MGRTTLALGLCALVLGLAGCKYVLSPLVELVPEAPTPNSVAPRISNLNVSPSQLQAGSTSAITFSFEYEDLNADVGPNSAQIEVQASGSGNFDVDTAPARVSGAVMPDQSSWGRKGSVTMTRTLNVPQGVSGTVSFNVTLLDGANQRSNTLTGQVSVASSGGGVGPGGDKCTIIDGNGAPTTSVRIGRQVFFRVVDEDNNFSSDRQDRLFRVASFQGGASGDIEVIFWMLETGVNTGVFEGPPGGTLLTSRFPVINNGELSVLDNDTVVATYQDPNSVSDVCIAIAKVQ